MKLTHAALFCGLFAAAPALAQSPLMPVTVSIQRYDQIVNATGDTGLACCAPHILESGPEADYLHIRMVFDVAFSDTVDRVSVNSSDILLMLPGAEEGLRAIGHYDHVGIFVPRAHRASLAAAARLEPNETAQACGGGLGLDRASGDEPADRGDRSARRGSRSRRARRSQRRPKASLSALARRCRVSVSGFGAEAD